MFKSLRTRLIGILLLLTMSMMIVIGTVLVNSIVSFYHNDFTKQMDSFFNADMMKMLTRSAKDQDSAALSDKLSAYSRRLGVDTYRNYYILRGDGRFVDGSNAELGKSLDKTANLIAAMAGKPGTANHRSGAMDYAIPITGDDQSSYIIYIKDTMEEVNELTSVMMTIIVQTLLAAMLIALLLSFFLARTITSPVENLTFGAQKIAAGDFSQALTIYSDDEIGKLTATFNEMADVLKHTLDEVNFERSKLETIFLYLTDGVVAFDKEGCLLHVNKAAKELFSQEWWAGKNTFEELFAFAKVEFPFEELLALKKENNIVVPAAINHKVLTIRFASLGYSGESNSPVGLLAVIHDITEQQLLENSRREFIANVSHELRTPLTNIKSYTETVLDNEGLNARNRNHFLTIVSNEADRMSRIVRDLMILSRLDSHKEQWSVSTFPLEETVLRARDAMLMEAEKHGDTMTVELGEHLPEVTADKEKVEQVIINILSNAIKYTQDGGAIRIAVYQDGDLFVNITDNGFGIPPEDLPRLFERFYRVDKARSREKGGTGLGLSIAREIMRCHQGDITVTSRPEQGTSVLIRLPVKCHLPQPE